MSKTYKKPIKPRKYFVEKDKKKEKSRKKCRERKYDD